MATTDTAVEWAPPVGYSTPYRVYIVALLTIVYSSNYADRQILSVVTEAIKKEFTLSDSAMGAMGGFAFAIIYTLAGIPVAILADRTSRKNIMATAAALWSVFTTLCGFTVTYWQLLAARVGVGIGEAGGSPPAHALISDLFPPKQRATALAVYSTGVPLGVAFAFFLGPPIAAAYGWREAFFLLGIPGLILSIIVFTTIREPKRGLSEHRENADLAKNPDAAPSFAEVLRFMWSQKALRHVILGATIVTTVGYAGVQWNLVFLQRSHGLTAIEAGKYLGFVVIFGSVSGTFLGGFLADLLGRRDARWNSWIVALMFIIGMPFGLTALQTNNLSLVMWLLPIPTFVAGGYLGPTFAMTQNLVGLRMRATASAVLLFIINLVGMSIGPWLAGFLSDHFEPVFHQHALREALFCIGFLSLWGVAHFYLASRTLIPDYARAARA